MSSAFGYSLNGCTMRGGVNVAVWMVLVFCSGLSMAAEPSDLVKAVCPNALKTGDPSCKNGGTLRAINNTDYMNCAYCNCPKEWKGSQCDLCTHETSCPEVTLDDGTAVKAVSCTGGLIYPTDYEFSNGIGKEISCVCGGDETTDFVCAKLPATNLQIKVVPPKSNMSTEFNIKALQRAGTPSQDYWPPCDNPDKTKCMTKERYRYAYPQVWEGDFQQCSWDVGTCLAPLTGDDCINYVCKKPTIQCPPPNVEKCPGWTPLSCGNPPNEEKPYWTHHCNPLAVPWDDVPIQFSCKPQPLGNGTFQCYMAQPGLPIASLGLQCYTGTCVYPHLQPDEHHQKGKEKSWKKWILKHSEFLLLMMMRFIMIVLVIVAGLLIHRDKKRSLDRAEKWEFESRAGGEYPVESIAFTPALYTQGDNGLGSCTPQDGAVVRFSEINYHAAGKHILVDVSGTAAKDSASHESRPGSILAIMGPSGAGKTSLLDILSGNRSKGVTGNMYVDGNQISAGSWAMKKITGYVHQDDVLPGTSTVFEYLLFHAVLRLPRSIPQEEKEARVFSIIRRLGLGKVSHNLIGDQFTRGLSGGEKRRVSICCELLLGPKIMMLDEPTTGLDSTNASKVVDALADMATKGITCIMTIHQPRTDVFRTIDRVLLMSGNGQVVYAGPSSSSETYFSSLGYQSPHRTVHVVDHMLDVTIKGSDDVLHLLVSSFSKSDIYMEDLQNAETFLLQPKRLTKMKHRASFMQQLRCLSTRLLRNAGRHPVLITVNFTANLVVAILLGFLFYDMGFRTEGIQSRLGVLFFIILFLSMMSLSSLPVWRDAKLLFLRERDASVYGTPAYFLSILLFDLIPLRVLPPILFSVLSYSMIGLHENCADCILRFTLVVVLTNVVATLMSMMIGAASPSSAIANTVGSMAVMVLLLFGGFLLNKDEVPWYVSWIADLSYFNYGYEALAVNEFHGATNFVFSALIKDGDLPPLRVTGDLILCEFGFDKHGGTRDVLVLLVIGVVCASLTYLFLFFSGKDISFSFGLKRALQDTNDTGDKGIGIKSKCISNFIDPAEMSVRSDERPLTGRTHTSADVDEADGLVKVESLSLAQRILPSGFRFRNLVRNGIFGSSHQRSLVDSETQDAALHLLGDLSTNLSPGRDKDSVTLSWHKINCEVWSSLRRKGTKILHNVHGVAGPELGGTGSSSGSMLFAIMGPSGAGKTTLMDILAGRKRDSGVSGEVFVNGRPVIAREIRKLSGYVLQDDVLPGTSTVYECMLFHAKLRLPSTTSQANIEKRVLEICDELGLQKVLQSYIGDSFVRGLSGGEKRRLSIACELLEEPQLMFLDEPTTGLDSTNAAKVVDILSSLTESGITIMMTIHQPRSSFFTMIKRILMLSGNGQVVYTGSVDLADEHLLSLNYAPKDKSLHTADFMLDLIIKSEPDEVNNIIRAYSTSAAHKQDAEWRNVLYDRNNAGIVGNSGFSIPQKYEASHLQQLKVLSSRLGRNLYRHPMLVLLNFVSSLLVSVGVGAVYFDLGFDTPGIQNRLGSLFFILMYLGLMSISSMPLWHEGRLLFVRERASGLYGTTSYFLSIIFFDIVPMRILPPILFGVISYFMIGLRAGFFHVLYFILIVVLVNVVASTFSMTVGAAISSTSIANMVACLFILSVTLLGGFFLGRKQMDSGGVSHVVGFLSKISYMRYAYEALLVNELHDAKGFFLTIGYHCVEFSKKPQIAITGNEILRTFGFSECASAFSWNVFALFMFIVVHLGLMYTLVKLRDRAGEPPLSDTIHTWWTHRKRRNQPLR